MFDVTFTDAVVYSLGLRTPANNYCSTRCWCEVVWWWSHCRKLSQWRVFPTQPGFEGCHTKEWNAVNLMYSFIHFSSFFIADIHLPHFQHTDLLVFGRCHTCVVEATVCLEHHNTGVVQNHKFLCAQMDRLCVCRKSVHVQCCWAWVILNMQRYRAHQPTKMCAGHMFKLYEGFCWNLLLVCFFFWPHRPACAAHCHSQPESPSCQGASPAWSKHRYSSGSWFFFQPGILGKPGSVFWQSAPELM